MHLQAFSLIFALLPACSAPDSVPLAPGQAIEIHPGVGLVGLTDPSRVLPAPTCGHPVAIAAALPDSTARPDRDGEWLALINLAPEPVELRDYRLIAGRRKAHLDGVVLEGGATIVLGAGGSAPLPVQLRNGRGQVRRVDPCGLTVSRLAWGGERCARPGPGDIVVSPDLNRDGPVRAIPGGAVAGVGGCGQT